MVSTIGGKEQMAPAPDEAAQANDVQKEQMAPALGDGNTKEQVAPCDMAQGAPGELDSSGQLSAEHVKQLTDDAINMPFNQLVGVIRLLLCVPSSVRWYILELIIIFQLEFERRRACGEDKDASAAPDHAIYPTLVAAKGTEAKKPRKPG